jgi:IS5 family transposase
MQPGFFDHEDRLAKLEKLGDPLPRLDSIVDWQVFRPLLKVIHQKQRKSNARRKPHDVTLMFKMLVLQALYNLSDDQAEFQVRDRLSFQRFLGLSPEDTAPDAKTLWLFREQLARHGLIDKLFQRFDEQLWQSGLIPKGGQIIDASLVSVPKNRNTRDENKQIKEGKTPDGWEETPNMKRQKDADARWTKKHGKSRYGHKNHINIDKEHKLIRRYAVTDASVHDSQVFDELLDEENGSRSIWADSAYRCEDQLREQGYQSRIHRKGSSRRRLNQREQATNHRRSKVRAVSRMSSVISVPARATSWCVPRARCGRR